MSLIARVVVVVVFLCYFREEAGDITVKEEIMEVRKYLVCSLAAVENMTESNVLWF